MNPLPHAVLVALAICSHHAQSFSWPNGPSSVNGAQCVQKGECSTWLQVSWEDGYEKCGDIYQSAGAFIEAEAEKETAAEMRAEHAAAVKAAAKDQPKLQAALRALESMK